MASERRDSVLDCSHGAPAKLPLWKANYTKDSFHTSAPTLRSAVKPCPTPLLLIRRQRLFHEPIVRVDVIVDPVFRLQLLD